MDYQRLTNDDLDSRVEKEVRILLKELSPDRRLILTIVDLKFVVCQPDFYLWICKNADGRIVAVASIYFVQTLNYLKGYVEDVAVLSEYRGQGIGQTLLKILIGCARENGAACIELTSNPKRKAANRLYQSFGFEKRKTNCYRLPLRRMKK